jgi:hypothetical protein
MGLLCLANKGGVQRDIYGGNVGVTKSVMLNNDVARPNMASRGAQPARQPSCKRHNLPKIKLGIQGFKTSGRPY